MTSIFLQAIYLCEVFEAFAHGGKGKTPEQTKRSNFGLKPNIILFLEREVKLWKMKEIFGSKNQGEDDLFVYLHVVRCQKTHSWEISGET